MDNWKKMKKGVKAKIKKKAGKLYTSEELESIKNFVNSRLGKDKDLQYLLPMDKAEELFDKVRDGVLLAKLINACVRDTIDERVINFPKKKGKGKGKKGELNRWKITENHNLVINSAKGIGCKITNIGTQDIYDGAPHLIMGLIWQTIKIGLLSHINLKEHPELVRLLNDGETLEDFLKLPPEQILLRWFNYQLKQEGEKRRVNNFGKDISDSHCYTKVLKQISKNKCGNKPLEEKNKKKRAELMLQESDKIGCREFIFPIDVTKGNEQLNFCFVANLFNQYPNLEPVDPSDYAGLDDFDSEGSREERAFRYWIQSLGYDCKNLYVDLRDGVILLKIIDVIRPKTVLWKKVTKKPKNKFQAVGNTNMVVDLGRDKIGISTVGIGGTDILSGNKKLTLAVVWQLMKAHQLALLEKVGKGKKIDEADLINWGNKMVKGKVPAIRKFKEKTLGTGLYCCWLCKAISSRSCDENMFTDGKKKADALLNAKYAISVARKIGATIFLTPEDIQEVKDKMILTFFASLMYVKMMK